MERIRRDQRGAPVEVGRALEVLAERLFDPELTVKRLRRDCQIRDNSFSLRFHQHCRQPPAIYIRNRRLETAEELLANPQLTASRIAEIVGYSSLQVFSDAFERWAKVRPSAYRKRAQALPPAIREELLNTRALRLACLGELDAEAARRLIEHLQDLYDSEEPTAAPPGAAMEIPQNEQDFAAGFWSFVKDLPPFKQRDLVQHLPFRSAALFHLLRRESRLAGRQDRERGVQLASLALDSLYAPGRHLPPKKLLDLKVLGWAWLGNAQRLALDFAQAERSFMIAAWHLPTPHADRAILAEYLELLASLRWYQRRLDEAVALQDRAVLLQRRIGDPDALAKALITRGMIHDYSQHPPQGRNSYLEEALRLLDHEKHPYISLVAHFHLALTHFFAGDYQASQGLLLRVQAFASRFPDTSAMLRVQWLEGLLCHARGDVSAAVRLLKQAYDGFCAARDAAHMAMAGIDLAAVQLEERSFAAARSVCLAILPCFQALKNSDTFANVEMLLQQALEGEQLQAALLHEIQHRLRGLHLDPRPAGSQPAEI